MLRIGRKRGNGMFRDDRGSMRGKFSENLSDVRTPETR